MLMVGEGLGFGGSGEDFFEFLSVVPVFLIVDLLHGLLHNGGRESGIVQDAHVKGRFLFAMFQHAVEVHGFLVRGNLIADFRFGEQLLGRDRGLLFFHIGDAVHEGGNEVFFFGLGIFRGKLLGGGKDFLGNFFCGKDFFHFRDGFFRRRLHGELLDQGLGGRDLLGSKGNILNDGEFLRDIQGLHFSGDLGQALGQVLLGMLFNIHSVPPLLSG